MSKLEEIAFSYASGYILSIVIYVIVMLMEVKEYLGIIWGIFSFFSVLLCILKRNDIENGECDNADRITCYTFLCLFYVISLLVSLCWMTPDAGVTGSYDDDLLFWLGDAISLKKDFLPLNFRSLIPDNRYHYGGAMQQALISMVTGIPVYKLGTCYSYIESVMTFGLAAYCLTKRLIGNTKIVFVTLYLVFFSTGIEINAPATYIWHIYIVPMSFTIALGMMLLVMLMVLSQDKERLSIGRLFITIGLLAVTTITKGPSGAIILAGIGIVCIYWLFVKKECMKAIIYGACSLMTFIGIYISLLMERQQSYDLQNTADVATTKSTSLLIEIIDFFEYCLKLNPWIFIPVFIYLFMCLYRKRKDIEDYSIIIMIGIGVILGGVIEFYGYSEMYFSMSVFPFAAIIAGKMLKEIDEKYGMRKGYIICLMAIVGIFMLGYNYKHTLSDNIIFGLSKSEDSGSWRKRSVISLLEFEAYDWVRQNTDEDILILSDRWFEDEEMNRLPGVFTERYVYSYEHGTLDAEEGRSFFNCEMTNFDEINELGIDYVICHKNISPLFFYDDYVGEMVYSNDEVRVYKY